jgi:hypothetical protein
MALQSSRGNDDASAIGYAIAGVWPLVVMFGSLALGLSMALYGLQHPAMSQAAVAGGGAIGVAFGVGLHLAGIW